MKMKLSASLMALLSGLLLCVRPTERIAGMWRPCGKAAEGAITEGWRGKKCQDGPVGEQPELSAICEQGSICLKGEKWEGIYVWLKLNAGEGTRVSVAIGRAFTRRTLWLATVEINCAILKTPEEHFVLKWHENPLIERSFQNNTLHK